MQHIGTLPIYVTTHSGVLPTHTLYMNADAHECTTAMYDTLMPLHINVIHLRGMLHTTCCDTLHVDEQGASQFVKLKHDVKCKLFLF